MNDKGEIVSTFDVDENIALQIWTKGFMPRLSVFNKNQNSRKLIKLSWLEKMDRKLSIKGKKGTAAKAYEVGDFLPAVQRILSEYAVYTMFRPKMWKFAVELEKIIHTPELVSDKSMLALLSEEKRSSLWLADLSGETGRGPLFRPFFSIGESEKGVLESDLLIKNNARDMEALFQTGAIRTLVDSNPARWYSPVRLTAAAMLLGFSFCDYDCDDSEFIEALWRNSDRKEIPGKPKAKAKVNDAPSFTMHDSRLCGLCYKLTAFIRHFEAVKSMGTRISLDSEKDLLEEGYTRKRRVSFPENTVGDVSYSVTFFDNDAGSMAISCKPKGPTLRHKGELIYTFPTKTYEDALVNDSVSGSKDEFFTTTQLARAHQFSVWYNCVALYVSSFAGLL